MSKKYVRLVRGDGEEVIFSSVHWCASRICRFIGFQFRRRLKPDEALVMVYPKESVAGTSIHMFFVFTPLTVIWMNNEGRVTHVQLARPWRPYYASPEPACYVLECAPEYFGRVSVGEMVKFS